MSEPKPIVAPFTPEQVSGLNRWQTHGAFHAFTCPDDGSDLLAAESGWCCPSSECSYTQQWAHAFMVLPEGVQL